MRIKLLSSEGAGVRSDESKTPAAFAALSLPATETEQMYLKVALCMSQSVHHYDLGVRNVRKE